MRTGAILATLLVLIWITASRCGGPEEVTTSSSTTAAPTTTTTPPLSLVVTTAPEGLPASRYAAAAAPAGQHALVLGGIDRDKKSRDTILAFNTSTSSTTTAGSLAKATNSAAAATIDGSAVFVFGGSVGRTAMADVQRYDPETGTTRTIAKMPSPRTEHAAVVDPESPMIYLVGGWDGTKPVTDVWATLDGETFQTVAPLTEPVTNAAAVLVGDDIWVFGGQWDDVTTASIQRIDVKTGAAEVVGKMATPVSNAMAFTVDGEIFLAGGRVGSGRSNEIRRFDPATASLTPVGTLPTPLSDAAVVSIGRVTYLLGGLAPTATAKVVVISPRG